MNLLEHYVEKIYSVADVTEEFEKKIGHKPHEKLYKVDMDINCMGNKERVTKSLFEKEYLFMKQNGYYMA